MDVMESIRAGLKELILPELDRLREDNRELKALIQLTNKRLDDVNIHMADQSRRIDEINKRIDSVREELVGMIQGTNKRIDSVREELVGMIQETNKRIDSVRNELIVMIMDNTKRIDANNMRIDDLNKRIDETNDRIDKFKNELLSMMLEMSGRIDQLKETMVRREEAIDLDRRVYVLEQHVETIQRRLAA